jgi:hypothetical protein
MRLTRRLAVALIASVVLALVVGGVGAGLTLAQQQPTPTAGPPSRVAEKVDKRALAGRVVSVDGDRLTVRDQKRRERVVQLRENTVVRRKGRRADRSALAPGASVAAFGLPRADGALDARLIVVNQPAPNR